MFYMSPARSIWCFRCHTLPTRSIRSLPVPYVPFNLSLILYVTPDWFYTFPLWFPILHVPFTSLIPYGTYSICSLPVLYVPFLLIVCILFTICFLLYVPRWFCTFHTNSIHCPLIPYVPYLSYTFPDVPLIIYDPRCFLRFPTNCIGPLYDGVDSIRSLPALYILNSLILHISCQFHRFPANYIGSFRMALILYDPFTSSPIPYVIPDPIYPMHTLSYPWFYMLPLILYITCSSYMFPASSIHSLFLVNCMHSPYSATDSIHSPLILYISHWFHTFPASSIHSPLHR